MQVDQITITGNKAEKISLDEHVFGVEVNPQVVAQYVHVHNQRRAIGTKKTLGRGEVAGGGRKPWRQKGTGRARHGSIRSPIWVGGGHTHALIPRTDRRVKMNRQMKSRALFSVLSAKLGEGSVIFVDKFDLKIPKTKQFLLQLGQVGVKGKSTLIVTESKDILLERVARNIPWVRIVPVQLLSAVSALKNVQVLFVGSAYQLVNSTKVKND